MKYIIEGHILKVIRMICKCNCQLFEMEIYHKTLVQIFFSSKDNYVNCTEYRIAFIKKKIPDHVRKLGIPSLNMVICSFVSFCVWAFYVKSIKNGEIYMTVFDF